jgi:sialic acid synthase SpsE
MKFFKIRKKTIGKNMPTYFIADIGANHDGSLTRAKKLIRLAKLAGADAAKFQHFSAKTIVSDAGFKKLKKLKSHQSKWRKSVFSVYEAASINKKWTKILKKYCDKIDIEFMTSPYSMEIVDEINPYVNAIKIGSGDITWIDIIKKIASKNKLGIIATGASNFEEVKTAVKEYLKINKSLVLMQCNTNYTGDLKNIKYSNLNVLNKFKKKFPKVVLGLSDHTFGHVTVLGAVMLGARVIEKHFTDNNKRTGPDHFFAMNPKTWKEMLSATRDLESAMGDGVKRVEKNELNSIVVQRRSIRANQTLNKGTILKENMFDYLRPCPRGALRPCDKKKIINKKLKKDIKYHEIIKFSDVF